MTDMKTDRTDLPVVQDDPPPTLVREGAGHDCGVFVDVDRDLGGTIPGGIVADILLDRVRCEQAKFVVLNFHDRHTVPAECLRLIRAIGESRSPVPIVVTEAGDDVRMSLVGTGLLAPSAVGVTSSARLLPPRGGAEELRVPPAKAVVVFPADPDEVSPTG